MSFHGLPDSISHLFRRLHHSFAGGIIICYSADANQMGRLASVAVQRRDAATLETLLTISQTRKIVPPIDADALGPLAESEEAAGGNAELVNR